MLQTASPTTAQDSVPASTSFAGLLAAFTAPASNRPKPPIARGPSFDGLEDDVAILSYDRALRAHSRYRAPVTSEDPTFNSSATDRSQMQSVDAGSLRIVEAASAQQDRFEPLHFDSLEMEPDFAGSASSAFASETVTFEPQSVQFEAPEIGVESKPDAYEAAPALPNRHLFEKHLKTVSITIRVSSTECEQLRARAAEAGLTVSAYLRSCTFEAESLRTMVKDTLSQMRSETSTETTASASPIARSWLGWLLRFWPSAAASARSAPARASVTRASFSG